MSQRLLVTGADGQLGRRVVEILLERNVTGHAPTSVRDFLAVHREVFLSPATEDDA